jgi:hypothetical protein
MPDSTAANCRASADYLHIDVALKSLWQPFNELVTEIDLFVPRPLSDYEAERQQNFKRLRGLNPAATHESLTKMVDDLITFAASEGVQFADHFTDRFMTQYVTVVLLSHALCEAAINSILAMGLVDRGSQELFPVMEKAEVKEKWRVGPKCFFPNYKFDPGIAMFETLSHLTKQRNALVHNKIHLQVGDKTLLEGSKFERRSFQENIRWMRRFFSLPYDLTAHAMNQLKDLLTFIPLHSAPVVRAAEHRTASPSVSQPLASAHLE